MLVPMWQFALWGLALVAGELVAWRYAGEMAIVVWTVAWIVAFILAKSWWRDRRNGPGR